MRVSCVLCLAALVVPAIFMTGCGKPSESTSEPAPSEKKKPVEIPLDSLPPLSGTLPPLDDGRVEIAPPPNWHIPSRSSEYVVRFQITRKRRYPIIAVTGEDYETVFNVSDKGTAETFAQQRSAAMAGEGVTLAQKVTPLRVGPHWGIAYMKQGKDKNNIIDQMIFETVVDGRKYKYEMRMLTGDFEKHKSIFFAVVGRTKFLRPAPSKKPAGEASNEPDAGGSP